MRKTFIFLFALAFLHGCGTVPATEACKERSFGLHFDFHAGPADTLIGSTLSEDDIREICDLYRPDFIQVDCKGHPGWTSYPSKLGNSVPGIVGNPLATWRRVTREKGVGLYVHYSGLFDVRWCEGHPDDAVLMDDGTRSSGYVRPNSQYVDSLLIPQMLEVASLGVDGCWIDGDCWAAVKDSDPRTLESFREETGIDLHGVAPLRPGQPYYREYADYTRELYCRYQKRYVDAIHAEYPDFKVISNWAYTEHMPIKPRSDVDFVSGDLPWRDCIYWARYSGRSALNNGIPWDFMAWAFRIPEGQPQIYKNPVQLMQEGAEIISLGGGFQMYFTQLRDGSPRMDELRRLAPVAEFFHARKPWTYGGRIRPQVAVLSCLEQRYAAQEVLDWGEDVFTREGSDKILGLVGLLTDAGHSVTTISEDELRESAGDYAVIVVPELYKDLDVQTYDLLSDYVLAGGSVLLTGSTAIRYNPLEFKGEYVASCGKGKLAAILGDQSQAYMEGGDSGWIRRMNSVLGQLYEPEVRLVSADGIVEIVDMEKDGQRCIQLVNGNGRHHDTNVMLEDSIPPVRDICLSVRTDMKPRAVTVQPEGRRLDFEWQDGYAVFKIPELEIHSTVVLR